MSGTSPASLYALAPRSAFEKENRTGDGSQGAVSVSSVSEGTGDGIGLESSALSPQEIAEFLLDSRIPKVLNWGNASLVGWRECVRDESQARTGPLTEKEKNYFHNQIEVRAELLRLIKDLAAGELVDPGVFIERYRNIHKILLMGKDGNSIYCRAPSDDPDGDRKIALTCAARFVDEKYGRGILTHMMNKIRIFTSKDFAERPSTEKVRSVAQFYTQMIDKHVNMFPYGNHSLQMNLINAILRLHGLRGVLHGNLDKLIIRETVSRMDAQNAFFKNICAQNNIETAAESQAESVLRDTGMSGPGRDEQDRREMAGGLKAMRWRIAKALGRATGQGEDAYAAALQSRPPRELRRMYEYVAETGDLALCYLPLPLSPPDALVFLLRLERCRKAENFTPLLYEEAARYAADRIRQAATDVRAADVFLEETRFGGEAHTPVHRARILQAGLQVEPALFGKVVAGSIAGSHFKEFLLLYCLVPDRLVLKKYFLSDPSNLPPELRRLLFGQGAMPSALESAIHNVFMEYIIHHGQPPNLETLTREAQAAALQKKIPVVAGLSKRQVKECVDRLNRIYHCDLLLSDTAIGFCPERLRGVREGRFMTRHELERKTGLSLNAVTLLENGRIPKTDELKKIAAALGVDPLYFIETHISNGYISN